MALASAVLVAVLLINVLLLWLLTRDLVKPIKEPMFSDLNLPKISVLVAARNEEANLSRCLSSLIAQAYPKNKLEILIGNDGSTDRTQSIAEAFEANNDYIKSFLITSDLGAAKGKANVLAQLARKATGEVFLVTDADMSLPPTWCKGMVSAFSASTGIVTGYTAVNDKTLFDAFQSIDWVLAIGMMKVMSDMGRPVTSMGNNMAVLASAYRATGGYEKMPFSVTEDFQLSKAVMAYGFRLKQLLAPDITGVTLPVSTAGKLLQQRKRWMTGAVQLPYFIVLILGLQAAYYAAAVYLVWMLPWFLVILLLKAIVQVLFFRSVARRAGRRLKIAGLVLFEFYSAIISLSTLLFYVLPVRVKWKDRQF